MTRFKTEAQGNSEMAVLDTDLLGKADEELSINLWQTSIPPDLQSTVTGPIQYMWAR